MNIFHCHDVKTEKPTLIGTLRWIKLQTIWIPPIFQLISFACPRNPSRDITLHLDIMPYYQSLLVCYISHSYFPWPWQSWGVLAKYLAKCSSIVWCFSHDLTGVMGLEKDSHRGEKVFSSHMRHMCYQCNVTDDANLGYLNGITSARFLYCKVTIFLHFIFCSWKQVSKSSPRSS